MRGDRRAFLHPLSRKRGSRSKVFAMAHPHEAEFGPKFEIQSLHGEMKRPPSRTRKAGRRSVQFGLSSRELPHKSDSAPRRISAELGKGRKLPKRPKIALDKPSGKRGRKPRMDAALVLLASDRHGQWLKNWRKAINWKKLQRARSRNDVEAAFRKVPPGYLDGIYRNLFPLVLRVVKDPAFPKERRAAQIRFLADSLSGEEIISPRRARDICAQQRNRSEPEHEIIRREFYVECTCGYKGPALNGGCRQCGSQKVSANARILQGVRY